MKSPVNRFYKYYKIDNYLYSSLINNEIFFSDPRNFNDPFDSNPIFRTTQEISEIEGLFSFVKSKAILLSEKMLKSEEFKLEIKTWNQYFGNLLENFLGSFESMNLQEEKVSSRLIRIYSFYCQDNVCKKSLSIDKSRFQKLLFADLVFLLVDSKKLGITCGSLTSTCPVMWGHYAHNHTGICIEFDLKESSNDSYSLFEPDQLKSIQPVHYSNDPIDLFRNANYNSDEIVNNLLRTKSTKWEYEKEIRLIHESQGTIKFHRKAVKKVIFGARTTPKDRYSLLKLMACLGYRFDFRIARLQTDKYEVMIGDMQFGDLAGSGVYLSEINGATELYEGIMNERTPTKPKTN